MVSGLQVRLSNLYFAVLPTCPSILVPLAKAPVRGHNSGLQEEEIALMIDALLSCILPTCNNSDSNSGRKSALNSAYVIHHDRHELNRAAS